MIVSTYSCSMEEQVEGLKKCGVWASTFNSFDFSKNNVTVEPQSYGPHSYGPHSYRLFS